VKKTKKYTYLALGWLFFTLGFVGAFLPVLPTTPFMLLALACFSRGSEKLHTWLYNHPRFGETLQNWEQHRVIPIKAKITAVFLISLSALYLIFFSTIPEIAVISSLIIMFGAATFVVTRKSRP